MEAGNLGEGTRKLYYEDPYMNRFTGTVLSCTPVPEKAGAAAGKTGQPDDAAQKTAKAGAAAGKVNQPDDAPVRYAVILDQTAFFPEEGGQSPDLGTLGGIPVQDVQIHDGVIMHFLDTPLQEGSEAEGILDFANRFSNMQQHSAEHLLSGLIWKKYGYHNVGFHLSSRTVTADYDGTFTADQIADISGQVNALIWQDFESRILYPSGEELEGLEYRSKLEISGQVRLVEFPGADLCACCAPHVRRTGEIGLFTIVSAASYKGGTRITMLAGSRALRYLSEADSLLAETARVLSTSRENLPRLVSDLREEVSSLKAALGAAEENRLKREMEMLPETENCAVLFSNGVDARNLREAVNMWMKTRGSTAGIFDGTDEKGYRFVIGGPEAAEWLQKLRREFGASGGGKPPMMQGSVAAAAAEIRRLCKT